METSTLPRPPYDVELISIIPSPPKTAFAHKREDIPEHRQFFELVTEPERERTLSDPSISVTEQTIQGPHGDIALSILASKKPKNASGIFHRPGILHIHAGGLTAGNRFTGADLVVEWVRELDAVAVLVEYGRPPEHPFPGPLQDCYTSLLWMVKHADELGIDVEKLMVEGQSAGGGLAAATVLMARDKGGPKLHAQLIGVPMLDDRMSSISCQQYPTGGTWNAQASAFSWQCYLGDDAGQEGVSYLASPGRATDLSGLPPAYIDVSSTEAFRDEAVGYATKLWASGVQAELHVWPGGPHAFDVMAPTAALSQLSNKTRTAWVKRTLGRW
ncbi:hypothetical protein CEP51_011283 [Fusarium floridanum]|uniref:Alpha/beta hydrolase fold-3 domain-containing protein n=1 Tax=Fusarium floridanum TaxID=1325733 RepID=A0A428RBU0_9HYPO|nr:hypothetical protein CEP51_011283 [Fusarium floridanum]